MARFLFVDPGVQALLRKERSSVGGASVQALNWMQGLAETGHEVGFVGTGNDVASEQTSFRLFPGYHPIGGTAYVTRQWPYFKDVLERYEPDYVYQAAAGMITVLLSVLVPRCGGTFVHRVANNADFSTERSGRFKIWTRLMYPYALRRAGVVLCQTTYQSEMVQALSPDTPVFTIGNPLWIDDAKRQSDSGCRAYVAWIGRFVYQKNLPMLAEIAVNLPDVEFRIAGRLPESDRLVDSDTLKALDTLRGLENVHLCGFLTREEVFEFLSGASMLLCTSRFEGFPNVFLEAWGSGTPVVTTRAADPDAVVERQGLGFSGDSAEDLTSGIRKVLRTASQTGVSDRVREYVRSHHDAVHLSSRLAQWLDNVCTESQ